MDNGMPPGTTTDNASTTAGATPGMATSADASAMAAASGPVTDTQFYEQALAGGEKEIAASKLAQKNGGAKVKDFARMIISDHTKLGDKVKAAAGKDVTAPPPPDTAALDGKTGNDFDTAYLDQMVSDHQNAIAMFENASKNASTDKAKKLAGDALPTLRKHLDAAQKLQASMK
jgi:putative membrane protein